jgi:hypothetical protein
LGELGEIPLQAAAMTLTASTSSFVILIIVFIPSALAG